MVINGVTFSADCEDILIELQSQLHINGIELLNTIKSTPKDVLVTCPYHKDGQERRPSAGIRKSDGLFSCFTCHEVHSLQEVISHCFGHYDDMIGAFGWNWLLKNFASVQVEERKNVEFDISRTTIADNFTTKNHRLVSKHKSKSGILGVRDISSDTFVSEEELDSYRYEHPYWAKRGITNEEVIELFDLGYDKNTNCVTMPNYDIDGNCVFVARRSVKTKWFNYPQNVEKIVYGIYQLYRLQKFPQEVYITESMIDCIYLWQFNKYACALNGLGTNKQFDDLRKMPCRKYILATDSDDAGMKARERLRKELKCKIVTEVILPKGKKDINECTVDEIMSLTEVF